MLSPEQELGLERLYGSFELDWWKENVEDLAQLGLAVDGRM